jgi:hypothetical protein
MPPQRSFILGTIDQFRCSFENHKYNAVECNRWLIGHLSICSGTLVEVIHWRICNHKSEQSPDHVKQSKISGGSIRYAEFGFVFERVQSREKDAQISSEYPP